MLCGWCVAGVTDTNAVRMQVVVPGADVNEHSATNDGQLDRDTSSMLIASVKR